MVRGTDLFFILFNNLAIFIALVAIYGFILSKFKQKKWYNRQIIFGISFGLFAIGCMYARIPVYEGVIVDQRNAIIALSGAFGGGLSAVISAVIAGSFRAYLGGSGVVAGVIGVSLAALSGALLHLYTRCFSTLGNALLSALGATDAVTIESGFTDHTIYVLGDGAVLSQDSVVAYQLVNANGSFDTMIDFADSSPVTFFNGNYDVIVSASYNTEQTFSDRVD